MCETAILGAGPIGAAVAHRLAERGRVRRVVLVDTAVDAAAGIALDIQQSAALAASHTRLRAAGEILTAASADVIVLADRRGGGDWEGPEGIAVVTQLMRAGIRAPFVFAGPTQHWLMETAFRRLEVPRDRLVGTAAAAIVGTVQSVVSLELHAPVDVVVTGRPPAFVIGWSAATVCGALVRDRLPAHRLLAIGNALPRYWPPGPYAIASATAPIIEALGLGSRQRHLGLTIVDGELNARGSAVLLPLELAHGRVRSHVMPSLSDYERTALANSLEE
jgi:hypothetical protein